MKRAIYTLMICMMAIGALNAQDNLLTIKGSVTDEKSKEPLAGVTIHVQGKQVFTQSNGDGKYVIKIPASYKNLNVIYSIFGYVRDTVAVKDAAKRPNIKLKRGGSINLSTVKISEYTPQTLVKEAVNRIPANSWCDTTIGTFFYRDVRQLNGELYLFDEMVFDALRVGYDKHNETTQIHVDKQNPTGRPIESNYKAILYSRLLVNDTAYIKEITGGNGSVYLRYSDNDVLSDPVERPNTTSYLSTSKRKLKSWKYKMETFTDPENEDYYLVTMTKDDDFAGFSECTVTMTIRKNNLAIMRLEYNYDSRMNDFPWPLKKLNQKAGIDSIFYNNSYVYNYGDVDGRMTLTSYTMHNTASYFYSNDTIHGQREQHFAVDAQCVLISQRVGDASFFDNHNIQTPVRIAVSERQANELRYDEEFWSQYIYVPLEETIARKLDAILLRIKN